MTAALAVGAAGLAIADLRLLVICWRRRTVLGGLLASVGLALVAFAFASGPSTGSGEDGLAIALVC